MAAAGAGEGGVGGGGEHLGEAVFAEAVSALEEERDSLVLVVPRVAHGTARDLHLLRRPDHLERKALKIIIGKIRERERESRRKCEKISITLKREKRELL